MIALKDAGTLIFLNGKTISGLLLGPFVNTGQCSGVVMWCSFPEKSNYVFFNSRVRFTHKWTVSDAGSICRNWSVPISYNTALLLCRTMVRFSARFRFAVLLGIALTRFEQWTSRKWRARRTNGYISTGDMRNPSTSSALCMTRKTARSCCHWCQDELSLCSQRIEKGRERGKQMGLKWERNM